MKQLKMNKLLNQLEELAKKHKEVKTELLKIDQEYQEIAKEYKQTKMEL